MKLQIDTSDTLVESIFHYLVANNILSSKVLKPRFLGAVEDSSVAIINIDLNGCLVWLNEKSPDCLIKNKPSMYGSISTGPGIHISKYTLNKIYKIYMYNTYTYPKKKKPFPKILSKNIEIH